MKKNAIIIGTMILFLIIGACSSNKESTEVDYHLPILEDWIEIQLETKKIGNDTIDLWDAEFSFEGDLNAQFEEYLSALKMKKV